MEKSLDESTAVQDLAGALFGVLDQDNSGFIDEYELDQWVSHAEASVQLNPLFANQPVEETAGFWINSVHRKMLDAQLQGNPLREHSSSDDEQCNRLVKQIEKTINDDFDLRKLQQKGLSEAEVFYEELAKHDYSERQLTIYKCAISVRKLEAEIDQLNQKQRDHKLTHNGAVNGRLSNDIAALRRRVFASRDTLAAITAGGAKITRKQYIDMFCLFTKDRQSQVDSYRTRSQVAMKILQRKIKRPLQHNVLRRWEFKPKLAYYLFSASTELLLHQDYCSLRRRSGAPLCVNMVVQFLCGWQQLATNSSDYCILLQDIYFIETGYAADGNAVLISLAIAVVGLIATCLCGVILQTVGDLSGQGKDAELKEDIVHVSVAGVLASFLPFIFVSFLGAIGKLRKPYIHLGCTPGGGAHGNSNYLGGSSPFYISLRRSAKIEDAEVLAEWIRSAAVLSRQNDIKFVRQLAARIASSARSDKQTMAEKDMIAGIMASHHRGAAALHHGHRGVESENVGTADVV